MTMIKKAQDTCQIALNLIEESTNEDNILLLTNAVNYTYEKIKENNFFNIVKATEDLIILTKHIKEAQ